MTAQRALYAGFGNNWQPNDTLLKDVDQSEAIKIGFLLDRTTPWAGLVEFS